MVSDRLLASIRDARLPVGARLPSERELGERFGVSRTVIREALRHLAAIGVLDVQTGSGARIAQVDGSIVVDSIGLFLRRHGLLNPEKIHEVRQTLELETTRLAAARGTEDDLRAVREAYQRMAIATDAETASQADVEFHRAIARAAENDLYLVLVDSISDVLMEIRRTTLRVPGRADAAVQQHRLVLEALERRDVNAAVDAMRRHLADSFEAFRHAVAD
jgi:GntR family transcriptional repressor for pyruvate dehydrogenase complex